MKSNKVVKCQQMTSKPIYLGRGGRCNFIAKYYASDINMHLCKKHLIKIRAFSENPIELNSGDQIDRHKLYQFGKVEKI